MKIIVLMKEVPDTYGDRKLNLETGLTERGATEAVIDEIGERALEVALSYADKTKGVEIIVVSMAPQTSSTSLRKTLSLGATKVVHVSDDALAGGDLGLTAEVLAAAIHNIGFDLIIAGNVSTDGSGGVLPAMIAELLGVPHASALSSVRITSEQVAGTRETEGGIMEVAAPLPAIISITEQLPAARFPSFKGIMTAKKKPYQVLTAADLGIGPGTLGAPRAIMVAVSERPPRAAGTKIFDEGDGGEKLAEFLIQNRIV